jgi:hypothetical protein
MKIFSTIIAPITTFPILVAFIGKIEWGRVSYTWFQNPIPPCWFLEKFGVPCASCGLTRGWISLVHGDIHNAITYNPNSLTTFLSIFIISAILWEIVFIDVGKKTIRVSYLLIVAFFLFAWTPIIVDNFYLYKNFGVLLF